MPTATPKKRERIKEETIQLRVKPEVKAAVQRLADQDGITVTALVTQLLMREIATRS